MLKCDTCGSAASTPVPSDDVDGVFCSEGCALDAYYEFLEFERAEGILDDIATGVF